MAGDALVTSDVGEGLLAVYNDLIPAEARLAETLASRQVRVGVSVIEQWPTLTDYLHLYGRGLSPAGLLVLGGGPDEGSRRTGIPFTGPALARKRLGVEASGSEESPSGKAFWEAIDRAREANADAPLESLFGTVHLALARPFDFAPLPEVREASAEHVLRLIGETRPQAVVVAGAEALDVLAVALRDPRVRDLTEAPESSWAGRWPPGTRLLRYPYVEVPAERPFRVRLVPVPSFDGRDAGVAIESLASVLAYAWAA